jgi:hypothetical protein
VLSVRHICAVAKLGIVAATVTMTGFAAEPGKPIVVYHDGSRVLFTPGATGTHRIAKFGPWGLGERLDDENLREERLNLYVVFPGGQYHSFRHRQYNHTLVINQYTVNGKPRGWDVFWCLVLDPRLHNDLRSEHDLLVAANQRFRPANDLKIQRIPAHAVMAEELNVTSVDDLRRFRAKDGSLPRVLIVPAHLAVKATTTKRAGE